MGPRTAGWSTPAACGGPDGTRLAYVTHFVRDKKTREPGPETALAAVNRLRQLRVLIAAAGPRGHALKIRPPLTFTTADADEFLDRMGQAIREV